MGYPQSLNQLDSNSSGSHIYFERPQFNPPFTKTAHRSANPFRMHAVAFNTLRTAQRPFLKRSCRIIGGSRYPLLRRQFHRSAVSYRVPEDPNLPEAEGNNAASENPEQEVERTEEQVLDNVNPITESSVFARTSRQGKPISGRSSRLTRQRQPEGVPPLTLPPWFFTRNVKCVGDADQAGSLAVFAGGNVDLNNGNDMEASEQSAELVGDNLLAMRDAKYLLNADIYKEIFTSLKVGLALRPPRNSNKGMLRAHTLLQCPKDGGTYFLDAIVEKVATGLGADLVRLDAQDIAQILGPHLDENLAWTWGPTSLLGYNAQKAAGKLQPYDKDTAAPEEAEGAEEEDEPINIFKGGKAPASLVQSDLSKRLASLFGSKKADSMSFSGSPASAPIILGMSMSKIDPQAQPLSNKSTAEHWYDMKVAAAMDAFIGAPDLKRASKLNESVSAEGSVPPIRDVIIQLKDYKELSATNEGPELIQSLRSAINKRWQEGRNVILVGTTSTEDCGLTRHEIQHVQSDIVEGEKRTILVPPDRREEQDVAFDLDEKVRIRSINIRHIEDMIIKLAVGNEDPSLSVNIENDLDNAIAFSAGLEDSVLTYSRIHRLAVTILGLDRTSTKIDGVIFGEALKLLIASDEAKFSWGAAELKMEDEEVDVMIKGMNDSSKKFSKEKLRQIKKNCTPHEKRLLGGVIMPSDIHTTFADVHAPKETVEALKTLTSISLIRPEAFSYGVLATNKIPGLLLYGPPGTGKTLLAKAVAKESGATVLEVSGAEVNDMYVGEGEKNVKAIFTLAKKLSPCVVFIDEADAIFAQRSDSKRNGTHRELINQFLREWDGMNDLSAFIMVATNRPFDLDEAVLRRLPRRLLVDLPVEKDREAILKIHLKDELLDESVSLSSLAKNTPFYSGSDLKNIAVAAALACIREENETAAKHTGDEPYVFPEKRILTEQHFDKAIEEISASISEDMSTLSAIRKFDEKYGDRKGRRKKGSGLGFGGTTVEEKDSEAGRVRKVV